MPIGLISTLESLLDRRCPRVVTLMFHGLYTKLPNYALWDGWRDCMLSVSEFEETIRWCSKRFHFLRIDELNQFLGRRDVDRPGVIISFDDALASLIDLGLPILGRYKGTAVVFVTTDWTDSGATPHIFLLERELFNRTPVRVNVEIGPDHVVLEVPSKGAVAGSMNILWQFLFERRIPAISLRDDCVQFNGIRWTANHGSMERHFWYPAGWSELMLAAQNGAVEIGSHMTSHIPIPWLGEKEKKAQLLGSRRRLEEVFKVPVTSCSYPHGLYDQETLSIAKTVYEWSFGTEGGWIDGRTPKFLLPRYNVSQALLGRLRWKILSGRIYPFYRRSRGAISRGGNQLKDKVLKAFSER